MRYHEEIRDDRNGWGVMVIQQCMICGSGPSWLPLQVHEIIPKSQAPDRWWHRCNALLLCQHCHSCIVSDFGHENGYEFQLAVKFTRDREHFDLHQWFEILLPGKQHKYLDEVASDVQKLCPTSFRRIQ